jgi:hypothetical protein
MAAQFITVHAVNGTAGPVHLNVAGILAVGGPAPSETLPHGAVVVMTDDHDLVVTETPNQIMILINEGRQ